MKGCNLVKLCALSGISRQAYYAGKKVRQRKKIASDLIVEQVKTMRKQHPRMGTRKLLHELRPTWQDTGVEVGRDRLFEILGQKDMLVKPKRLWVRTTDSRHNLPLYRNLLPDREPTAPNQVWVADITYLRTDQGWQYLSLITDLFSRKIVGWHLGESLDASESVKALEMAVDQLPDNCWPIHHSDRGSQYCCYEYTEILRKRDLSISMTEENHCYENCYAERVNGILKNEYNLDLPFRTKRQARLATEQAIAMYNNYRPHKSLGMRKPSQVHQKASP